MARRKITQAQANRIKKRYLAIIEGRAPNDSLDKIQADENVARTTIYALRDKNWDVMAKPPRTGTMDSDLAHGSNALRARVELLEQEVHALTKVIVEALGGGKAKR